MLHFFPVTCSVASTGQDLEVKIWKSSKLWKELIIVIQKSCDINNEIRGVANLMGV
jgi:hypothetical protein